MSPLTKRIPRELTSNFGKCLGLLLLVVLATSFTSGFLTSAASIDEICDGIRTTYNTEDFYFTTLNHVEQHTIEAIEEEGACVYENFYRDVDLETTDTDEDLSIRLYAERPDEINQQIYIDGKFPETDNEIGIDRVFAANHGLNVGDTVKVAGETFTISGIMTLADHSVTYKSSGDLVFNSVTFTVGQVNGTAFERLVEAAPVYKYSVMLDDRTMDLPDRVALEERVIDILANDGADVTDFVDADDNIGLTFAPSDIEGDRTMWLVMLFVLIIIMGFVFIALTNASIEQESAIIGMLLASGVRKRELVAHYMTLPAIIGIAGGILGNVIGRLWLTLPMKEQYYNSYSLPPFVLTWHWDIFALTTIVPICLLLAITLIGLLRRLHATPLQFLRHEATRKARRGGAKLPGALSFPVRFRLRVFLQNISHFATLFLGIMFGSILLLMALCLLPLVNYNADLMASDIPAEHLYTLKAELKIDGTADERSGWAAIEELTTNPDFEALDLDLFDSLKDQLDALGVDADAVADEAAASTVDPQTETMIKASLDQGIDASDANVHAAVRLYAHAAGIDLSQATDEELTELISTVDAIYQQVRELPEGAADRLEELLSDIMKADSLEAPVNQTPINRETLDQVERFAVTSLALPRRIGEKTEDITVYGIPENSRYWNDIDVSDGRILIGQGAAEKCTVAIGEPVMLHDRFHNDDYEITIDGTCGLETSMSLYMSIDTFNELFGNESGYFNGYISNEELPLDARYVASELTPKKMQELSLQMTNSMSNVMRMLLYLVIPIYLVLIYLLTKTVIDHNARYISYMKVFGYHDREVIRLYVRAITVTVIASLIICLPIIQVAVNAIVGVMLSDYPGNIIMYYPPLSLAHVVLIGVATYLVVAALHILRIRRVPLALTLKVQE